MAGAVVCWTGMPRAGAVPRSWCRCVASELCAGPAAVALLHVRRLSVRCCVLLCLYSCFFCILDRISDVF